jgi:hypothetical protein
VRNAVRVRPRGTRSPERIGYAGPPHRGSEPQDYAHMWPTAGRFTAMTPPALDCATRTRVCARGHGASTMGCVGTYSTGVPSQ